MQSLPSEILGVIIDLLPLKEVVFCRRVSKAFHRAVASIAPVEQIPQLLHRSNYTYYVPVDESKVKQPRWRKCGVETLDIKEKVPAIARCNMAFGTGWAAFAGKMNQKVWRSKLVRWLRRRGELDLIPWREMLLLRVAQDQADLGWRQNQVVKPEPIGRDSPDDEDNPYAPILPTNAKDSDAKPKDRQYDIQPFRLSSWRGSIIFLEKSNQYVILLKPSFLLVEKSASSWDYELNQALESRRKDEYTESDDDWEGSTTTSEGRVEWRPWVVLQLEELLKEHREIYSSKQKKRQVQPVVLKWQTTDKANIPALQSHRYWHFKRDRGTIVVQQGNEIFFLLW